MYDAGGALAAEYSTATPTTTPTTSYMTTDHLGSPRVITDKNGAVISRRDFMPFGEEIYAGVGGRNTTQKYGTYGSDNIRKRYTGYEKDDETQLDFAQARMYQNKHGRFTAVDPLMASADPINPQTFNRYIYTGNNPINFNDPSGLDACKGKNDDFYFGTCKKGDETIKPGSERPVTAGSIPATNGTARVGDIVRINANDTVTIVTVRNAALVDEPIQSESNDVRNGSAEDMLTTESGNGGGTINTRLLESVPTSSTGNSNQSATPPDDNATELRKELNKNPLFKLLDKVLNPDGITLSGNLPLAPGFGPAGFTLTITRDFDIVGGYQLGIDLNRVKNIMTGRENLSSDPIVDAFKPKNLFCALSLQANYILESNDNLTPNRRQEFFKGSSLTVSGCNKLCVGVTKTGGRSSFNIGVSPGVGGGVDTAPASIFLDNPHRRLFGPAKMNGGNR